MHVTSGYVHDNVFMSVCVCVLYILECADVCAHLCSCQGQGCWTSVHSFPHHLSPASLRTVFFVGGVGWLTISLLGAILFSPFLPMLGVVVSYNYVQLLMWVLETPTPLPYHKSPISYCITPPAPRVSFYMLYSVFAFQCKHAILYLEYM